MEKRKNVFVKKIMSAFMALTLVLGLCQMPVAASTNPKDKTEFLLDGNGGASTMNIDVPAMTEVWGYLGFATTDGAVAAQKYLQFTYTGDITFLRLVFENKSNKQTTAYWMNKDQKDHLVTADGSAIPLKATKATTVIIDLKASGINYSDMDLGIHTHNGSGDPTIAAGALKLYDAKLITNLPKSEEPKTQTISAKNVTKALGDKTFALGAKLKTGKGKLSYQSSNKKVVTIDTKGKVTIKGIGSAKITITAAKTAEYKKTVKTVKVTVNPKKATLSKVNNSVKKAFTASWVKDSKVNGYQIRYTTDKKLKKNIKTSSKIKGNKTVKTTVKNLTKGKTYYVQVRSYKTVGKTTFYGSWSKAKAVKIAK